MRVTRISLRNVMAVQEAEVRVENNKLLLYGPNSAGKSSLMYGLLALLYATVDTDKQMLELMVPGGNIFNVVRKGEEEARIEAEIDGERYGVMLKVGGGVTVIHGDAQHSGTQRLLKISSLVHVTPCTAAVLGRGEIELCEQPEIEHEVDPPLAECINKNLYTMPKFSKYYSNFLKMEGEIWLPLDMVAYGYRRALGMIAAACIRPDFMFIEGFEAGLHYDLAVDLLDLLTELPGFVAVEAHIALMVHAARKRGWSVYYVKDGSFLPVRPETLDSIREAMDAEARAYAETP